jgi:hypothetical protein
MTPACDECGAALAPGAACREYFDFLLGREWSDRALQDVHHLTVACYALQHPVAFDASPEAQRGTWALLREAVNENLPAAEVLRRNRVRLSQGKRPLLRNRGRGHAPLPPAPAWTHTAAEVVNGPDADYAGRVRRWARAMVADEASDSIQR